MADRKIDLTVTLEPGTDAAVAAKRLQAAGLEVSDVFDVIGVIQGRAAASARSKLSKVPGVTDLASIPVASVGPPDAEIS